MQDGHVGQLKLETDVGLWWFEFRLAALIEPKNADGIPGIPLRYAKNRIITVLFRRWSEASLGVWVNVERMKGSRAR